MTMVSDILAFAAQHPDYWDELLDTARDLPSELDEGEVRAITAAIEHIGDAVEEVLHLAAQRFGDLYSGPGELRIPTFRPTKTRQNRTVQIPPSPATRAAMYRIEFTLERNWSDDAIERFPAIVVKKGSLEEILGRMADLEIDHESSNFHIYGAGLSIQKDALISDLAEQAAKSACDLMRAVPG